MCATMPSFFALHTEPSTALTLQRKSKVVLGAQKSGQTTQLVSTPPPPPARMIFTQSQPRDVKMSVPVYRLGT